METNTFVLPQILYSQLRRDKNLVDVPSACRSFFTYLRSQRTDIVFSTGLKVCYKINPVFGRKTEQIVYNLYKSIFMGERSTGA